MEEDILFHFRLLQTINGDLCRCFLLKQPHVDASGRWHRLAARARCLSARGAISSTTRCCRVEHRPHCNRGTNTYCIALDSDVECARFRRARPSLRWTHCEFDAVDCCERGYAQGLDTWVLFLRRKILFVLIVLQSNHRQRAWCTFDDSAW